MRPDSQSSSPSQSPWQILNFASVGFSIKTNNDGSGDDGVSSDGEGVETEDIVGCVVVGDDGIGMQ